MMVKIRLQRFGTTKRPFYRIVAADSHKKRDGRYLEIVGLYDPTKEPAFVDIDKTIAMKWLQLGAQPTDTVKNLLSKNGIIAEFIESKKSKK
ncbi:MAG: 30S ribosomal protein S16 [Candidatus Izemoplasmatales bacterium]|nr:30S ribosomal protein S16 [Candidatus Izemoplasmatales bacterium]MDD4595622.1 30S ribosomal protein S16 [Candidatus Izemoplasmatales bacterium]